MQIQTNTTQAALQKLGTCLFNFGLLSGLATLTFGLVSCGGGGASTPVTGNTTPTITSITPVGIVASSSPQTLSILGTNFAAGMNLSIANSSGVTYTITASSVKSSTVLAASAVITTAPSDNYVTFAIKSSSGTTTLASTVLGVATTMQTAVGGIQTIFNINCAGCHNGTTLSGGLDLSNASIGNSTGVIGNTSTGCAPRFRVLPGDPRRSSSVLIDKIKATSISPACSGVAMPNGGAPLSSTDIQAFVDWVAGGAN